MILLVREFCFHQMLMAAGAGFCLGIAASILWRIAAATVQKWRDNGDSE